MKHYTYKKQEIEIREAWDTSYKMDDVFARAQFEDEVKRHKQRVADMLKVARNGSGFSQREIGEMIGVTQQAIAKYEQGKNEPSYEVKLAISKITNTPIQRLL